MIQDALEIIVSTKNKDSFIESGLSTGTDDESNLVIKALKLMRKECDIPFLEIHLLKKIPFGAGIGGGSADAAFMLKLLNEKFDLGKTEEQLAFMASKLGADCPFFIYNRPLFASGIGEIFEDISLTLENYHLVLVKPEIHVPTKDAFALITPEKPEFSLKEIVKTPVSEWKNSMVNDFEKSIFAKYPAIKTIKDQLYELGAEYASMSGSGSSVYGIFIDKPEIKNSFQNFYVWES